ncbi:MAG: hypothetical protein WC217_00060 [Candidatus Paceibacterota bacterium]|jgi:3D (Asp-Asp-Asp) domain-containing protein
MTIFTALMGFLFLSGSNRLPAKPAEPAPGYTVTLTAYNAVPEQTDGNPFETASGAYSNPEVVAARSQDLGDELPFGTIIEIEGADISSGDSCGYSVVAHKIGYRVIEDTMNAKFKNRIDVLLDTNAEYKTADAGMQNAAQVLGICKGATYRVVGYVDINHIPKTQGELAKLVSNGAKELALNK